MVKPANPTKQANPVDAKKAPAKSAAKPPVSRATLPLHIVGIGASAGGLAALEHFFGSVPGDSGMAFIVVQHLDPTQKGMLPELLQRFTKMPVCQATNRMKVKANCVYVIPSNKDMSIQHGALQLQEPIEPRGLRLPIDLFFRSLAQDCGAHAIGVVLSGMGADGTLGLTAIKQEGGLVLAQQPETAQFNAMPNSAIHAGLADIIAPPEELPGRIINYVQQMHERDDAEQVLGNDAKKALEKVMLQLRAHTGNDFSLYKTNTLYRRIERRMALHQIETLQQYVDYLSMNSQEIDLLFKELLIGVTNFFRDPIVWDYLKKEALPALLKQHASSGKILRAWIPACSTGEEAYSLAIVFQEVLEQVKPKQKFLLQIFATDLDPDAIAKARQGCFPATIAADVSPERLKRFFVDEEGMYRIGKTIREMIIFAPQSIVMDPPFTKLDILSCRNLLIYLVPELQKKLIPMFHYALNSNGLLMLGSAETVGTFSDLFTALDSKARIYRRIDRPSRSEIHFPAKQLPLSQEVNTVNKSEKLIGTMQHQADQLLLRHFSPPAVLINADGDILYVNGRTGMYLEPAAGKANWNIYAMAHESLRYELANAIKTANSKHVEIVVEGLHVTSTQGVTQTINLTVYPIDQPEVLSGMLMIVIHEVANDFNLKVLPRKSGMKETGQIEELRRVRDEMQIMREELTSANEELQSANEELQSTNEELTTSKEEMQSMNEELQSVNAELQSKVDDLAWVNSDMKNLLNSTEIATVFLDDKLNVRRFTTHATQIFKLIAGDVGRPLSDIVTDLNYPELQEDAINVLQTLVFVEKQIPTRDGRWFKARIMPYRAQENVIDGVVMTFSDITDLKILEAELRKLAK
jgi:two-component system CheB/CheR fusion protein